MAFNPLEEKGIPLEKQITSWDQLTVEPYDKNSIDPYTRTRIILMNGIEVEGVLFSHQFARHTAEPELKRKLAMTRRVEQQQQKMINWMPPADESALEITIGYEQVAVDLTAVLAQTEPDPNVKAALDFALLEDFDHLYRYANLLEIAEEKQAEKITKELTEIMPGRPTKLEHRHPFDEIRRHYDRAAADPLTKLHVLTIVAGEQQTMNFYMNVGNRPSTRLGRGLYLEIAQIEEQHVTHYESLGDPNETWFERFVLHEYNECYMYYSCLQSETDPQLKKYWEEHLAMEIEHLKIACDLAREYGDQDPESFLPTAMPETLTVFESSKDYVRQILTEQYDLTADFTEYVPSAKAPDRYKTHQETVNKGTFVPSVLVIDEHREKFGKEYRLETEGPHPVEKMRTST